MEPVVPNRLEHVTGRLSIQPSPHEVFSLQQNIIRQLLVNVKHVEKLGLLKFTFIRRRRAPSRIEPPQRSQASAYHSIQRNRSVKNNRPHLKYPPPRSPKFRVLSPFRGGSPRSVRRAVPAFAAGAAAILRFDLVFAAIHPHERTISGRNFFQISRSVMTDKRPTETIFRTVRP